MYHLDVRPRIEELNWFESYSNNNFASGTRQTILVIVLYLLKNNIDFKRCYEVGKVSPGVTSNAPLPYPEAQR